MNYEEAVAYIEDIPRFTTKNSLDHTRECLRRLGDPQRKFRVIHVAGTNGKGSTCAFITSVLREAGYSCGLFTSPHLVEINERFQINEEVIDDDTFLRAFEKVKKLSDELVAEGSYHPTYFETLLLMGMVIFAEAGVDYVTLETGLGGRLDATTAVEDPAACVITSISKDHMQYLGNTIAEIAGEKAGIIKEGVPVIFDGSNETAAEVIRQTARAKRAPYYCISLESLKIHKITGKTIDFCYTNGYDVVDLKIPFPAEYQMMNASLAYRALSVLQVETGIGKAEIISAMEHTRWMGRMQQAEPFIYFDGAHNADGIAHFVKNVQKIAEEKPVLLFSMMEEKNHKEAVKVLCKEVSWDSIVLTRIPDSRGIDPLKLQDEFMANDRETVVIEDCAQAYRYVKEYRKDNQMVFCAGSLYLIGELEKIAGGNEA